METELLDRDSHSNQLTITPEIRAFLKETAKWAKFLAIIGFVLMGFMILAGIVMTFFIGAMGSELGGAGMMGALSGGLLGGIYIILAVLYLMPILYLYRFATKLQSALTSDNQEVLNQSFENLKSHYKFIGIMMSIMLIFYALIFLVGLAGFASR